MLIRTEELPALPFDLRDLKEHLGIELDNDDVRLSNVAWAAVDAIERETGHTLAIRTFQDVRCWFPCRWHIEQPPLREIVSLTYYDESNEEQELDSSYYYLINPNGQKAFIEPVLDWPNVYERPDGVTLTFKAGYSVLPDSLRQAVFLAAGSFNENREGEIVGTISSEIKYGIDRLLVPFRGRNFA